MPETTVRHVCFSNDVADVDIMVSLMLEKDKRQVQLDYLYNNRSSL